MGPLHASPRGQPPGRPDGGSDPFALVASMECVYGLGPSNSEGFRGGQSQGMAPGSPAAGAGSRPARGTSSMSRASPARARSPGASSRVRRGPEMLKGYFSPGGPSQRRERGWLSTCAAPAPVEPCREGVNSLKLSFSPYLAPPHAEGGVPLNRTANRSIQKVSSEKGGPYSAGISLNSMSTFTPWRFR
jgi:hypothetical protein